MLKQRVITALVLLAILLPALFASTPVPFIALSLVLIAAAAWEWARLNGLKGGAAIATGAARMNAASHHRCTPWPRPWPRSSCCGRCIMASF